MRVLSSSVFYWAVCISTAFCASTVFSDTSATSTAVVATAVASNSEKTAHQVVEDTTARMMTIITQAQGYFDKDPDRYYQQIEIILDEVVDFDSFAQGVMGPYASKQSYMALRSSEEKKQFIARMKRFSNIFRDGLVQTYAKGLLAFNGNKTAVLPPKEGDATVDSVTVEQHIYGEAEKPYVVHYKLRKNKAGDWKLRNVTIEAVNLGKVYQSQFATAAKQYNGDIDKVIDNWSVDPAELSKQKTGAEAG